jgi:hypothetical protein
VSSAAREGKTIPASYKTPAVSCDIAYIYVVELVLVLNLLDRAQLLTQKLLKQGYAAPKLKSSLQNIYGRHYDLVDRNKTSISQCILYFWLRFFLSYTTSANNIIKTLAPLQTTGNNDEPSIAYVQYS